MRRLLEENRRVLAFVLKMVAVYAAWFVLYDLLVLPDGRVDGWLSEGVAAWSAALLRPLGWAAEAAGRKAWVTGHPGVWVADGCNGLAAFGLFAGFLIAYPGRWRRRLLFAPLGIAALVLTNVVRCAVLVVVQAEAPEHFFAFKPVLTQSFYVTIFLMWMAWVRFGGSEEQPAAEGADREALAPAVA